MSYFWILLLVSFIVTAFGTKSSYIIFGYGFGVAALATTLMIYFFGSLTYSTIALCALYLVFGIRLGIDLRKRTNRPKNNLGIAGLPIFTLINVLLVTPAAFRLANTANGNAINELWLWIGAAIMCLGLTLEIFSDIQKNSSKNKKSQQPPKTDIEDPFYNYISEIVFWTGNLITSFGAAFSGWQWFVVVVGYLTSLALTITMVILRDFEFDN